MAYKKGQSGNPAGRKPGTKNKRTVAIEKGLHAKIEDVDNVLTPYLSGTAQHTLADDFNSTELTPRDRLQIAERLMQYRFPKMQSTSVDLTAKTETVRTLEEKLSELAAEPDENKDK